MPVRTDRCLFSMSAVLLAVALLLVGAALLWDPFLDTSVPLSASLLDRASSILAQREEAVEIRWYYSRDLERGAFSSLPLWRELRQLAEGGPHPVRITREDPGRDPSIRAELERLGARKLMYQAPGRPAPDALFSALSIGYAGTERLIPWVDSRETLAIELCHSLESLVNGRQDLVSLIASSTLAADVEAVLTSSGRAVRFLAPGQPVPASSDALLVFAAVDEISSESVAVIRDWIQRGGSCLFAIDRVAVDLNAGSAVRDALLLENPALDRLLAQMGVSLESLLVHDQRALKIATEQTDGFGGSTSLIQPYPWWPSVPPSQKEGGESVPFTHPGLALFWTSPLRLNPVPGWEGGILLSSSPDTAIPALPWYLHPAELSLNATGPLLGAQNLGLYLTQRPRNPAASLTGPGRIVVLGDSDILSALAARPDGRMSGNELFFLDCLDWLEGRDVLDGLRSSRYRLFELEDALPLTARGRLVLFLPLLLPLCFLLLRRLYPRLRSSR